MWEQEKILVNSIPPFPTMFSTHLKKIWKFWVTINLLYANSFNLDWAKILSSGRVNPFPSFSPGFNVYKSFIKTLWEKDKLLVMLLFTHLENFLPFSSNLKWSSSLEESKMLSLVKS